MAKFDVIGAGCDAFLTNDQDLRRVRARVLARTERTNGGLLLWIERLPTGLERPAVRMAYGAIALAAVAWFGVGQAQLHEARAALEVRVETPRETRTGPEVFYTVDPQAAARAARAAQVLPPANDRSTGKVEVTQSDLDELLHLSEHAVLRAMMQGPQSRARLAEVMHAVRSAVFVTIRFQTSGA